MPIRACSCDGCKSIWEQYDVSVFHAGGSFIVKQWYSEWFSTRILFLKCCVVRKALSRHKEGRHYRITAYRKYLSYISALMLVPQLFYVCDDSKLMFLIDTRRNVTNNTSAHFWRITLMIRRRKALNEVKICIICVNVAVPMKCDLSSFN
jgi:hypothetical protein